jgi:hypothetical protein
MKRASCVLALTLSCGLFSVATTNAATIDFESLAPGTFDPFSVTADGVTVGFDSLAPFFVGNSFFSTLTGRVLLSADGDSSFAPLNLSFSEPIASISLDFALNGPAATSFFGVTAFLGASPVGAAAFFGAIPAGFGFPEGSASFSGSPFDSLVLTSNALDFAVDDINFDIAAVPEPTSILLLGTGGLGLLAKMRRRKKLNGVKV